MKHRIAYSLTSLSLLILLMSCSGEQQTTREELPTPVKAQVLSESEREMVKTYTGTLSGEKQATIRSKLSEAVESIRVREGQRVAAGEVLIELDRYGPSSNYGRLESLFRNAEKNHTKMKYLYEQGAVSESEFDRAQTDFEVSKANFEAVQRMVHVQTPISGLVTSIRVSEGDYVNLGQHLATVATSDRLRVEFEVNSDDIRSFEIGDSLEIRSDVVPGDASGVVTDIASSADQVTRTFEVEALISNDNRNYKPGMFVRVNYIMRRLDNVVAVPRKAIIMLDNQPTVFVVESGRAGMRRVTLGPQLSADVVIESGVSAGDTLVTLGQDYLEDGDSLEITQLQESAR
jgi:RND family efflux transporter MFP subunit